MLTWLVGLVRNIFGVVWEEVAPPTPPAPPAPVLYYVPAPEGGLPKRKPIPGQRPIILRGRE